MKVRYNIVTRSTSIAITQVMHKRPIVLIGNCAVPVIQNIVMFLMLDGACKSLTDIANRVQKMHNKNVKKKR
jgi:hypothetical protein